MSKEPILNNPLEQYLREVNQYTLLSRAEEYELATHFRDTGDQAAARALVTANLRFVVKVAYQFSNYDIKLTDLIQEGNIGLMKAVQKFKPDTGFRLISYAVWWIKAYIQNYIINTWSLVRVGPVAQQRKVLFGKRELPAPSKQGHGDIKRLSADGTVEIIDVDVNVAPESDEATFLIAAEVANAPGSGSKRRKPKKPTQAEVDTWRKAAHAARRDMNIDNTISEDGRMTLGETLASDDVSAEDQYASAEITAMVADRLSELHADLNEKELTILEERLLAEDGRTLQDVGQQYGISRERVRQIEANLKKKIARRLEGLSPVGLLTGPTIN